MRVSLIFPPLGHAGRKSPSIPLAPPVLEYLAGLISAHRPDYEITLINANVEAFHVEGVSADLVGITVLTHQAGWAWRTADALRSRGVKVVAGGPHPSALPDEAGAHADSVIVGEAESVMPGFLGDFESNGLKPRYEGSLLPLEGLPAPRRDILKGYKFHSFFTSRGCPCNCKFCTTPGLHGHKMRYRPIAEVIEDMGGFSHRLWFSTDADIWGPDVGRYTELFREMSVSLPDIRWIGEGNISSIGHPEAGKLLKWARRSGLMQAWVGWENMNGQVIEDRGTKNKTPADREAAIKTIRDSGIDVIVFVMLGSMAEYEKVIELSDRLSVTVHPVMVVPYPGTRLYEDSKELLYGTDWDYYDGMHAVFKQDAPDSICDAELKRLWRRLFTYPRILKRVVSLPLRGLPSAHTASVMVQMALRRAFRQYKI